MKLDNCGFTKEVKYAKAKNKYFSSNKILNKYGFTESYDPCATIGKNGIQKCKENRTLVILERYNNKIICFQVTTTKLNKVDGTRWKENDDTYISHAPIIMKNRDVLVHNKVKIPKYLKRRLIKNIMNHSEKSGNKAYYKQLVKTKRAFYQKELSNEEIHKMINDELNSLM